MATVYIPKGETPTVPTHDPILFRPDIQRARERLMRGRPVSKRFRALIEQADAALRKEWRRSSTAITAPELSLRGVTDAIYRASDEERRAFIEAVGKVMAGIEASGAGRARDRKAE